MAITLRQLEIFLALAEHEHTSRAASALLLSQSAVSMALSNLETQLGEPVFDRTGSGLRLNAGGRRLRAPARDILRRARDVETLFTEDRVAGRLDVGASSTIGIYVLPEIVAAFTDAHADAAIRLDIGNSAHVASRVQSHAIDVGFVEGPAPSGDLDVAAWQTDELVLFCSASHPVAESGRLRQRDVVGVRWVLREHGSGTRAVFERAVGDDASRLNHALELGHSEAVRRAVEAGAGIGCLSRRVVGDGLRSGTLVEVEPPTSWELSRTFWRVTRPSAYASRLQTAFLGACGMAGTSN
jgi:DNA-binding transcriptional LysR family regulator